MKFEKKEELEFQDYRFKTSLPGIRTGIIFGLILYVLFGFLDNLSFPDSKEIVILIRYIFIVPFFILIYISTYYKIFRKIMNIVLSIAVIIPSFGIILMMVISKSGELGYHLYYAGIMVTILLASTFFKLKLRIFVLSCLIILYTYEFAAIYFQNCLEGGIKGKDFPFLLSNILFLFSIMIISSVITYMFELNLRKEFIQNKTIKEEKEKLKESEERNRILLENLGEGVTIIDLDENFVFANPAAEILFGVESGKLVGKNLRDVLSEKNVQKILEETENRKRKITSTYELEIIRPDGEKHLVLITATPYYDNLNRVIGTLGIFRDITERKKAEEQIKKSKDKFLHLVDNSPDFIAELNEKLDIISMNLPMAKSMGKDLKDIIGKNAYELFPDRISQERLKIVKKSLTENHTIKFADERNGKFYENIFVPSHERQSVQIIVRDITERKKMEKELIRLSDAFRMSTDSIAISDLEGKMTDVNEATLKMYGTDDKADLIGKNSLDLFAPEDKEKVPAIMKELMEKGYSKDNYYNVIIKDGSKIPVEMSTSVMKGTEGEPIGFVGITRDVTERKRAEEELRTSEAQLSHAMEIAKLGYWEYDVDDDLFTFNDHFYDIFRTTAEKVGGYKISPARYARLFLHPDDMAIVGVEMKKALETTDPNFSRKLEHQIIYADGEVGYISVRFFIIKDVHGRTVKTWGVNQDITERKQAEEELRRAYSQLEDTQQELIQLRTMAAMGEFAAGVAHEIRNPLANISALAQVSIDKYNLDRQIKKNLKAIVKSTERVNRIIKDLSDFAKPHEIVFKSGDIVNTINKTCELTKDTRLNYQVRLYKRCLRRLPQIMMDEKQMVRAFMNIIMNSIDAMKKGGRLSVSAFQEDEFIVVEISDTGKGIAKKDIDKIFNPFFTLKQNGIGLGLSVTHRIIRSHKGKIEVESKYNKGTKFIIRLPIIQNNK